MADADECAPPAPASSRISLYDSALTLPSDSENYSAPHEHDADHALSASHSSSSSPVIVYRPQQTLWRVLRGAAINLVLPFVNGLMLGLGELLAHEAAFRLGWTNTKIFPTYRRTGANAEARQRVRELENERLRRQMRDSFGLANSL